jgi:hypothetical protein
LGVLAAGACADGPVSGELEVRLSGPQQVRAVVFNLTGERSAVTAAPGLRAYVAGLQDDTARVVVVAPAGQTLPTGAIARVAVPDLRRAGTYAASVTEVAGPDYGLQNPSLYTLTVVRP